MSAMHFAPGATLLITALLGLRVIAQSATPAAPGSDTAAPLVSHENIRVERDVEFAAVDGKHLLMDVYIPTGADPASAALPCVMYIHGGAWRSGDKSHPMAYPLATHGYVVASINYRTSAEAVFPAQIYDCKAAIRFLRANAKKYSIDTGLLGVWGDSSGGHLAALVGTSGDVKDLEGAEGDHLDQSSRVQAACVYYPPVDFIAILTQKSNIKRGIFPTAPEAALLGGPTLEKKELAIKASPLTYVTKDDPPFLIVHGSKDAQVPVEQSLALKAALGKAGVETTFQMIDGAPHAFNGEQQATAFPFTLDFFDKHLKSK